MNTIQRIAKNTAALFFAQFVVSILIAGVAKTKRPNIVGNRIRLVYSLLNSKDPLLKIYGERT